MNQEAALLYNLNDERLRRVRGVLVFMGVRVRVVEAGEYGQKIGSLLGAGPIEATYQGPGFAEEMMVLRMAPGRVNAVIQRFQKHGIPMPMLTAVLTAVNAQWDSLQLAENLRQEHAALHGGGSAPEHRA